MFPTSGYRGMLALIGCMLLLMPLAGVVQASARGSRLGGLSLGIVMSLLAAA